MSRGWQWPVAIIALLGLGVGANIVLMVVARSNPSFAVEPDYYAKALAWDELQRQAAHNAELGWSARIVVERDASLPGSAELRLSVSDGEGRPLERATAEVELFPLARSAVVQTVALEESAAGEYVGKFALHRPGLWEFRLAVARSGERFTEVQRQELVLP